MCPFIQTHLKLLHSLPIPISKWPEVEAVPGTLALAHTRMHLHDCDPAPSHWFLLVQASPPGRRSSLRLPTFATRTRDIPLLCSNASLWRLGTVKPNSFLQLLLHLLHFLLFLSFDINNYSFLYARSRCLPLPLFLLSCHSFPSFLAFLTFLSMAPISLLTAPASDSTLLVSSEILLLCGFTLLMIWQLPAGRLFRIQCHRRSFERPRCVSP